MRVPNPYAPPSVAADVTSDEASATRSDIFGPRGIGGWLLLPFIALIVSLLLQLKSLVEYQQWFAEGNWEIITDPGLESYDPLWPALVVYEISCAIAWCGVALLALVWMTRHDRRLPKLMIGIYVAALIISFGEAAWTSAIPALADDAESTQITRRLIACCIWIPYFSISKRVQNTFVK